MRRAACTEYPPSETHAVLVDLKFCSDGHSGVCVFKRLKGWPAFGLKAMRIGLLVNWRARALLS